MGKKLQVKSNFWLTLCFKEEIEKNFLKILTDFYLSNDFKDGKSVGIFQWRN